MCCFQIWSPKFSKVFFINSYVNFSSFFKWSKTFFGFPVIALNYLVKSFLRWNTEPFCNNLVVFYLQIYLLRRLVGMCPRQVELGLEVSIFSVQMNFFFCSNQNFVFK